jgi:hypothetical protein
VAADEECAAFSFRGIPVSVDEVVRAAHFRNELGPPGSQVAWKSACAELAARLGLEPDEGSVEAKIDRFRYEKDLISAEETEAWLELRGLTAEDFETYFVRGHWWEILHERAAAGPVDFAEQLQEQAGLLEPELHFSGAFGALAGGLARRLLARASAPAGASVEEIEAERRRFIERSGLEPDQVGAWLESVERGPEWLEGMLELEAHFRRRCAAVLSADQLSRTLALSRLALTRLELERVEFDALDVAREAHLCVREDGLTLEEVARESRYPFQRVEVMAGELPEDQRQKLLCARLGEIQEPVLVGGVYQLARLLRKVEPTLDDPAVRRGVEQRVLDTHFAEAGAKDVRWRIL